MGRMLPDKIAERTLKDIEHLKSLSITVDIPKEPGIEIVTKTYWREWYLDDEGELMHRMIDVDIFLGYGHA